MNFRPFFGGVTVYPDHLEGYAWAENVGWVKLGSYSLGGSHTYANTSNADWGVNRSGAALSGYAWSETAGWINFNPTDGGVTADPVAGEFDGYAWGENVGWIHFRTASPAYGVTYIKTVSTTAVSSSLNPSHYNDSVTFTTTVTGSGGTPTGTVDFKDGGTDISGCSNVALTSGSADCALSSLAVGEHTITAEYSGDSYFSGSTSLPLTQTVNDVTAPTGSLTINSGDAYTNNASVSLHLSATDVIGVTGYYRSTSSTAPLASDPGWTAVASTTAYSTDITYTLTGGEGLNTLYVWYKDAAGNVSDTVPASITLDATSPIVSAGGDKIKNAVFTQTATATDANAMIYSWTKQSGPGNITFEHPTWKTTAISSDADGIYTLRFTATDEAGNSAYDEMTLTWDTTAPVTTADTCRRRLYHTCGSRADLQ